MSTHPPHEIDPKDKSKCDSTKIHSGEQMSLLLTKQGGGQIADRSVGESKAPVPHPVMASLWLHRWSPHPPSTFLSFYTAVHLQTLSQSAIKEELHGWGKWLQTQERV